MTVHTVQLLQEQGFRENESYSTLSLNPGQSEEVLIPVTVSELVMTLANAANNYDTCN